MNYIKRFMIAPHQKVKLKDIDPGFTDHHENEKDAVKEIQKYQIRLRELQELLYAEKQRSLLICLQAMDTGGKDGTINHVLGAMNPLSCKAISFKQPSAEELAHDFLWRIHHATPAKGEVVIFNRSHYEDVLIARVHNLVPKVVWRGRYEQINTFEQNLIDADIHIIKFYLHISKAEQLKRFKERLDDPLKQWKISESDYSERPYWKDYMAAYEDALSRCTSKQAPWFVIPANHKWFRNLAVSKIVVEYLEQLNMKRPLPSVNLKQIRKEYNAAKNA